MPSSPTTHTGDHARHRPLGWAWRHSSFSQGSDQTCVDVAVRDDQVLVRDSKDPDGPRLRFTHREWQLFLLGVRAGEFELHPRTADTSPHSRARCSRTIS
ncbi:DUF397 domain-containing protein [Pseudonocardia sp.]|uniref:DUF397 domain-containing protein n=1 Tax=Pseudonocardia sp. TaxID=60912 RepID=UPI003D09D0B5